MFKGEIEKGLSEKQLEEKYSQEILMEAVTGVPLGTPNPFLSPFGERHPSACYYYTSSGVLVFKDWSKGFVGGWYNTLKKLKGLPNRMERSKVRQLLYEFEQSLGHKMSYANLRIDKARVKSARRSTDVWEWRTVEWSQSDIEYWNWKYEVPYSRTESGIRFPLLEELGIMPISNLWINGEEKKNLRYLKDNPTYLYKEYGEDGEMSLKSYKPLAERFHKWRSLRLTKSPIHGLIHLDDKPKVLCKSLKDVVCLRLIDDSVRGYSFFSEGECPKILDNTLFYFGDNDEAGIMYGNQIQSKFNIPFIFSTTPSIKDIPEMIEHLGLLNSKEQWLSLKQSALSMCKQWAPTRL